MPKLPLPRKLLCHWLPADSEEENVPLHHHLLFSSRHVCHRILDQVKYCSWKVDLILSSFLLDSCGEKGFQQSWLIPFSSFLLFFKKKKLIKSFPSFLVFSKKLIKFFPSFLVPPESVPGRMTILVTVFLVLVNIFNSITSNIPKVCCCRISSLSEFSTKTFQADGLTAIEMFMIVNIIFVFCALIGKLDHLCSIPVYNITYFE